MKKILLRVVFLSIMVMVLQSCVGVGVGMVLGDVTESARVEGGSFYYLINYKRGIF